MPSNWVLHYCSVSGPRTSDALARVSVLAISERRAALGNDTPVPKQMNGAVPRTRLGINRWLARDPLFGCYREKHDKAATARKV